MKTTISEAKLPDAQRILTIQKDAYESEARLYHDWNIPPLTQDLKSMREDVSTMTVLKAEYRGIIVGSVRASQRGNTCEVGRLIVSPSYQKNGIGFALMDAIEKVFKDAHVFELFTGVQSEDNIRFYHRLGYRITGNKRLTNRIELVVMCKSNTEQTKSKEAEQVGDGDAEEAV